jgi:DNA-binding transcriptional MocR family regulator
MHMQRVLASGLEIVHVLRENDGPDIEAMRTLCNKYKPRAFLCSSILQNPTSTNLSPYKAFQILKLAEEFDFIIIDDDTYGDLLPPTEASLVTRLATLDQLKRVIHIGSFSKTLAPGLRVGFIAASPEHIKRVVLFKAVGLISNSTLDERVVHQFLSQGKYRHHCESLRSRLLDIREQTMAQLAAIGCSFATPETAGMYLWGSLDHKVDAMTVARTMFDTDYLMAPGRFFSLTETFRSYMRFNVAATFQSPAVKALRAAINS